MSSRRRSAAWIWFFIISVGVVAAWYFGWVGATRDFVFSFVGDSGGGAGDGVSGGAAAGDADAVSAESRAAPVAAKFKTAFNKIAAVPKKITTQTIAGIKNSLVNSAKDGLASALQAVEEGLGLERVEQTLPASPNGDEQPRLTLVFAAGRPVRFHLRPAASNQDYAVDWGDGATEAGTVSSGQAVTLQHVWQEPGAYLMVALVRDVGDGSRRQFSFPIVIE